MIKNIIKNLKPSSTLKINEISKNLELEGKKIYKFGFGQSPFQVLCYFVDVVKINVYQYIVMDLQVNGAQQIVFQPHKRVLRHM